MDISNPWSVFSSGLLFYADGLRDHLKQWEQFLFKIKRFGVQSRITTTCKQF